MDDEDFNEDIAAAMGFSSFGGAKKRKHDQTNSPKAGPDTSGANSTKLGVRPKIVADDTQSGVGPGVTHQAFEATRPAGNGSQLQPPASKMANIKGNQRQKQPAASGLAAFMKRGQSLPDKPPKAEGPETAAPLAPTLQGDSDAAYMVSFGGEPIPRAELNALRSGVRDEYGNTAYFLPSFVEDPWSSLKKDKS